MCEIHKAFKCISFVFLTWLLFSPRANLCLTSSGHSRRYASTANMLAGGEGTWTLPCELGYAWLGSVGFGQVLCILVNWINGVVEGLRIGLIFVVLVSYGVMIVCHLWRLSEYVWWKTSLMG